MRKRAAFQPYVRCRVGGAALAATVVLAIVTAGCVAAPPTSDRTRATSFEEFATGLCAAFGSLFRAVGNPDTGSGSELSNALKAAAQRGDSALAEDLAAQITTELEIGRGHASYAAGWSPGEAAAGEVDRLLVAFQRWTAAHVDAARGAASDPQVAFEQAGGIAAWHAMIPAMQAVASHRPAGAAPRPCPDVPVSI